MRQDKLQRARAHLLKAICLLDEVGETLAAVRVQEAIDIVELNAISLKTKSASRS